MVAVQVVVEAVLATTVAEKVTCLVIAPNLVNSAMAAVQEEAEAAEPATTVETRDTCLETARSVKIMWSAFGFYHLQHISLLFCSCV